MTETVSASTRSARIAGRTAVVTGAGNGLGREIACQLSAAGATLVLAGRDHAHLEETQAALPGPGLVATVDVSSPESVADFGRVVAHEDVSILVNNAGIPGPVAPLAEIAPQDWDAVFAVNVRGVFLMCRELLPGMCARGDGDIVNIASVSGKRPLARRTPYTASKMAVIGLTATLAHEVGPLGVSVNSLSPGPVAGPRMARNFALEAELTGTTVAEAEAEFVSRSALKRMVTAEEVGMGVIAMLNMPGLCGADIDLTAGMIAR